MSSILFVKLSSFYAAVEQADQPALKGVPLIVGGDPGKRGSVTSASPEALAAGVRPGMETAEALKLCPGAQVRPTRLKRYREVASEVRELVRTVTDRFLEFDLEGTFIESPPEADPLQLAAELCVRVQAEHGVHAVAGIAPTRFAAYLAAEEPGPGGIQQVRPEDLQGFLGRARVTELWGLGPSTAERLAAVGVERVAELREMPFEDLREIAGRNAQSFLDLARGLPEEPIRPMPRAKSLSRERTLERPSSDLRWLAEGLFELAAQLEGVLSRERRVARTVSLGLGFADGTQVSRTQTGAVDLAERDDIGEVAVQLLERTPAGARPVRRLRLRLSGLGRAESGEGQRQLRLF
ncbi:MAG: DNA polymerase IV [Proteobacteria bacterium]|nr:DNA polymerase IV [Pseudomonadota bacterium]